MNTHERRKDAVEQAEPTHYCNKCGWFGAGQIHTFSCNYLAAPMKQGHEPWPGTPGAEQTPLQTAARMLRQSLVLIESEDDYATGKALADLPSPAQQRPGTASMETKLRDIVRRSYLYVLGKLTESEQKQLGYDLCKYGSADAARGVQPATEQEFPVLTNPPDGSYTLTKCEQCEAWRVQPAAQEPRSMLKRIRDAHEKSKGSKLHFGPAAQESAPAAEQEELKPCPFCGGQPITADSVTGQLLVRCGAGKDSTECPASRGYSPVARWNTRAPSPAREKPETAEEIRRLRELLRETLPFVDGFNGRDLNRRIREALVATASPEEKV